MITDAQMDAAIEYLQSTDTPCAVLKTDMERAEWKAKRTKATVFQLAEGSVAERNAEADTHSSTIAAMTDYFNFMQAYNEMANKRTTQELITRIWQSLSANRRQGNIT